MTDPLESEDKVWVAAEYHCSKKENAVMKCGLRNINSLMD